MLRDIRELTDQADAYAEELRARWGGLLSYRYIGRQHASMDPREVDGTVKLRHDMRNPAGGLMFAPLNIAAPESGHMSDLEAVPNPVIHSCQILDPGHDVTALRRRVRGAEGREADGLQPGQDRRCRPSRPGARPDRGSGCQSRQAAGGAPEDGGRQHRGGRLARSAAAVAGVRRFSPRPTDAGRSRSSPPRWPHRTRHCTSGRSS